MLPERGSVVRDCWRYRDWNSRAALWGPASRSGTHAAARPASRADVTHSVLSGPVRQDEDVLDTWFSSALAFATLVCLESRPRASPPPAVTAPEILSSGRACM